MPAGQFFTAEEDVAVWRFAMEEHPGYGKKTQWELLKKRTRSERTAGCFYLRFYQSLLPNLSKAKFHVETKLMLCQKYDVKVDDEFLKELEKDAKVDLNEDGTVNSYQLKPNCPKNRDLEMDDEEFMRITSLITKFKRWSSEEDTEIWSYVLENLKEYTRGSERFWKNLVVKMNWNRTPTALKRKFLHSMVPNLHRKNFPIEQKLELYKRCQIPVDETYLETLKEHAELLVSLDGCITEYKMKTNRREKRKNAEGTSGNVKKTKRVVPEESSDDQDEDEDMVFDDIVPEEDDLILDHVVDRGWTNPDMIIRRAPKIEVDDDEDDPAVEELDDMFIQKEELFDEMNVEYAEMVHDDEGQKFGANPGTFENIPLNDDYSRVVDQRRDEQSDSMTKMLEIMQRMEQKMENQESTHRKEMSESFQTMSKAITSLQSEMQMIRSEMKTGSPDDTTTSAKKNYLLNFKKLVSSLDSPGMKEVEQRIDTALQNLPENDQSPPPTKNLPSILEVALTATGF